MKKILSFLILLAGVTVFTACGSDDASYTATDPLDIAVADVLFEAGGGEGSIVVNTASEISATTNADWLNLSVSNNVVYVNADFNEDLNGRSARIILTDATGATAHVTATQNGLLLSIIGDRINLVDGVDAEPVVIQNKSNAEGEVTLDADWIHYEVDEFGTYTFTFDDNEGTYRKGTFTITIGSTTNTFYFGQWGESMPELTSLNTAVYEDKNGETQTREINIVADGTRKWLIKGLFDEGDVVLNLSNQTGATKQQYYIAAGYNVGPFIDAVDSKEYTLRCIMSATVVATGVRYYPTSTSTAATNPYRMTFDWTTDDEANPVFGYVRPTQLGTSASSALSANYDTDGILGVLYTSKNSAANTYRFADFYEMHNLRFLIQE